ncbi:MAG: hypothetical protein ACP5H2_13125, partial [Solirubrobacteraceae bacterium]
ELGSLLERPLRLRTACDLQLESLVIRRPDRFTMPASADLESQITAVLSDVSFEHPGERTAVWQPKV